MRHLLRLFTVLAICAGLLVGPLSPAHAYRGSAGHFQLQRDPQGKIIRWDPCRTIAWRFNPHQAPSGALKDVKAAINKISKVSGLHFRYAGTTRTVPKSGYGLRSSKRLPLVVAWAKPGTGAGHSDLAGGGVAGRGGFVYTYVWHNGHQQPAITTGYVVLSTRYRSLPGGFKDGKTRRGGLLLHELGHAVGLDHVNDRKMIMNPMLGRWNSLGAGDVRGLRKVGRQAGCLS